MSCCPGHAPALPLLALAYPARRPAVAAQRAQCPAPSVPPAQRPSPSALGAAAPCPAPGPALVRTVSPGPKHRYRGSTFNPPYTDMLGQHPTSKISPMPFRPPENPGMEHPPGIDSPQKFFKQKSGLCSGQHQGGGGWFRRTPGCPLCEPWRVCEWPCAPKFIFPGGGLGAQFWGPVVPAV